jgi:hypothetical protein
MNDPTDPEWERWLHHRALKIRRWAAQSDLPDPVYIHDRGWRLDQFAMHYEPALVRERKKHLRQLYNPELRPKRTVLVDSEHGREEILVDDFDGAAWLKNDLVGKIHKRLLERGLRVEGIRPGGFKPEAISISLLEILHPVIEANVLEERGAASPNVALRFENVRIFRSEAESSIERKATPAKNPKGRPIKFTYFEVAGEIERKKLPLFPSKAALIRYFIDNLRLKSTGEKPKKPPSWRAVSDAIDNYGFMKFVAKG